MLRSNAVHLPDAQALELVGIGEWGRGKDGRTVGTNLYFNGSFVEGIGWEGTDVVRRVVGGLGVGKVEGVLE